MSVFRWSAVLPPRVSGGGGATQTVEPTGISSAEALGNPTVNQVVYADGFQDSHGVGSPTVLLVQAVQPDGISSAESLGSPTLLPGSVTVSPTGVGRAEALGQPTVSIVGGSVTVALDGIASGEYVSPVNIVVYVGPVTGITDPDAIGNVAVSARAYVQLGNTTATDAVGSITVLSGGRILLDGIESSARVGLPGIKRQVFLATTPGLALAPAALEDHLRRVDIPRGVTYYRVGSTWYSDRQLRDDLVADELYRGGYEYEVDAAKATELQALGFTVRTEMR